MNVAITKSHMFPATNGANFNWRIRGRPISFESGFIPSHVMRHAISTAHLSFFSAHLAMMHTSMIFVMMLMRCSQNKILNAIIGFVAVQMMNVLFAFQSSANVLLHYKTVLCNAIRVFVSVRMIGTPHPRISRWKNKYSTFEVCNFFRISAHEFVPTLTTSWIFPSSIIPNSFSTIAAFESHVPIILSFNDLVNTFLTPYGNMSCPELDNSI